MYDRDRSGEYVRTRDGEEEFQGRVEASGRGFLMRNLPDVADVYRRY